MIDLSKLKDPRDPLELEAAVRQSVLDVALTWDGTTDPEVFFLEAAPIYQRKDWPSKSWCQIFCLSCYRWSDLTRRLWRDQVGFAYALEEVERDEAKPADMTILENTKYGDPVWHGNLLIKTDGFWDHTIDGNTSEGVATRRRDIRIYHPRPIYKSIQPWVDLVVAQLQALKGLSK